MHRILFVPPPSLCARLFTQPVMARLSDLGELTINQEERNLTSEELAGIIHGTDACVTSWGSPAFTPEVIAAADSLKIISYAAGSVKGILSPAVFDKGIAVCTSQPAMAVSVAAHTVMMMEMMLRNVVNLASGIRAQGTWRPQGIAPARELSGKKVGIIGASLIGREVIRFLQPFDVEILISDPYLTDEGANALGANKVSMEEILATCDVISLHAPVTEETKGMITRKHLATVRDGAVFINTARGIILDHEAFVDELRTGRFSAALDVTYPEPLPDGHELFGMENVVLTPHISGGTPEMALRQGEQAVRNLELFFTGGTPNRLVTREMLATMA